MEPEEIIKETGKAADGLTTSQEEYNDQLTERLISDNTSDNWLSKNIRPLTLLWLMGLFTWSYITAQLTAKQPEVTYANLLAGLLTTAIMFYFGSRAAEKIGQMMTRTNLKITNRDNRAENRRGFFGRIFKKK